MSTGRHLQVSLDELTDEDMMMLSSQVRFLALILHSRAEQTGTARLSLPVVKGRYFPMDTTVSVDTLMTDVLELESVGFLTTFVGDDGLEHYRIERFRPVGDGADPGRQRQFIASVGREKRERASEGAREAPPRSRPAPPPPRFCAEHQPAGSGGEPCVKCQDCRMEFIAWNFERTHSAPPGAPHRPSFEEGPDDDA